MPTSSPRSHLSHPARPQKLWGYFRYPRLQHLLLPFFLLPRGPALSSLEPRHRPPRPAALLKPHGPAKYPSTPQTPGWPDPSPSLSRAFQTWYLPLVHSSADVCGVYTEGPKPQEEKRKLRILGDFCVVPLLLSGRTGMSNPLAGLLASGFPHHISQTPFLPNSQAQQQDLSGPIHPPLGEDVTQEFLCFFLGDYPAPGPS